MLYVIDMTAFVVIFLWRRRESNLPSTNTVIPTLAGAIDFFDYVFDYEMNFKLLKEVFHSLNPELESTY